MKYLLSFVFSLSCLCVAAQSNMSFLLYSDDHSLGMTSTEQNDNSNAYDRHSSNVVYYLLDKNEFATNPTSIQRPPTPITIYDLKKKKKAFKDNLNSLSLIADVFGGYSNFICDEVSPKAGLGFGGDIGIQCDYSRFWGKIPDGLFGEFTVGYSCRGSGAYPLHCVGARFLPLGYRYKLNTEWALAGKVGMYFAYPLNGIKTWNNSFNSRFDYGISLGLGVEWKKFGMMASYEHGFSNIVSGADVKLYNQGAFLSISYKFLTF